MKPLPTMLMVATCALGMTMVALGAPPVRDPDWPCEQIKVSELSLGAVWAGPPVEPYADAWAQDKQVADLMGRLAQRRMPVEQAQAEITAFAQQAGEGRQAKLLALFAGLYATLDRERGSVMAGLDRIGRAQKDLAQSIRADMERLRTLQSAGESDEKQAGELAGRLGWETRIFEDRRQSLITACAVPSIIEQRLFALGRTVQRALE
ncbi:hypothetical protein [Limobrevibacterium gyesilva]|uniref:Uncharacterized protein n=1 Tax=Limobrevibacterium gyesilva TaxID=2991712 RepID=A0AA41YJ97_9PROT|nr:hypothetical protein [Limobrevibacterium gyesilva]MCW3473261.1 hypothetical protein [Limobrevibacterium gyesilva]